MRVAISLAAGAVLAVAVAVLVVHLPMIPK